MASSLDNLYGSPSLAIMPTNLNNGVEINCFRLRFNISVRLQNDRHCMRIFYRTRILSSEMNTYNTYGRILKAVDGYK